jgi:hypothetical protein
MGDSHSEGMSLKVFNTAEPDELTRVLKKLQNRELNVLSQMTNLHFGKSKFITTEFINLFRTQLLRRDAVFNAKIFAKMSSIELHVFCEEVLKDSYENPSESELEELTPRLVEKFGEFRTQLLYASLIDDEAKAAEIARKILSETGIIPIRGNIRPKSQAPAPLVYEPISEYVKRGRKENRAKERDLRAAKRTQRREVELEQKAIRKLQKKNRVANTVHPTHETEIIAPNTDALPFVNAKRIHPLITRFGEDAGTHEDVSRVGSAFVRFSGDPKGHGKQRPVLVIAKTSKHFVVRPIYSHARWPAGSWRAVEIIEWKEAGLSNNSYVGDETHKVKLKNLTLKGRLTVQDWNRVCLGEINACN